jgi:hypothetical protein
MQKPLTLFLFFLCSILISCSSKAIFKHDNPDIAKESVFNDEALCRVAESTKHYLVQNEKDEYAVHGGEGLGVDISLQRVIETLSFICQVQEEDHHSGSVSRLGDPEFLYEHFDFYLWQADRAMATDIARGSTNKNKSEKLLGIPEEKILLTKYYTKLLQGSAVRTDEFSQALYAVPHDEYGMTEKEISENTSRLTRFSYMRSQIINGVLLNKQLAKPLIWISEDALHDVLLQGTGIIREGDRIRYFNVHKNNGIEYNYLIGMTEQERYWYFSEVDGVLGYGGDLEDKIRLFPQVSLAGDVEQLGLGKLFLVQYESGGASRKHLAVLADEGGAFKNNLFQLDLLVGSFYGWRDYYEANKHIPDYAKVWLMLKK